MISIIVAIGKNNLIGKGNDLPWHYPEDLKYFKNITNGKTVIMGYNTFLSIVGRIHKPLPNRKNIVATTNQNFYYEGVEVIHDLKAFLEQAHEEEIFVIGGTQIYEFSIPYADRLYITHVLADHDGDKYFPEIDYSKYQLISSKIEGVLDFSIYERVTK